MKIRLLQYCLCVLSTVMFTVVSLTTVWLYRNEQIENSLDRTVAGNVLLVVLIHASGKPEGIRRRDAIRKTWTSSSVLDDIQQKFKKKVVYKFILGGHNMSRETKDILSSEHIDFNDIVILDSVTDEHETLTQRTLKGFEYINENYDFSYVLKCDDDTFVDLVAIISRLHAQKFIDRLYWGDFVGGYDILSEGIYAENNWFICDRYIPYAFGGGYVVSRDLVELIVPNAPYLKQYMNEDVSLASWLSPYNFVRVHDQTFDTGSDSKGCMKPFIVAHRVSADSMRRYYRSLRREGRMCGRRTRTRKRWNRHIYDWSVLPSQCCFRDTL